MCLSQLATQKWLINPPDCWDQRWHTSVINLQALGQKHRFYIHILFCINMVFRELCAHLSMKFCSLHGWDRVNNALPKFSDKNNKPKCPEDKCLVLIYSLFSYYVPTLSKSISCPFYLVPCTKMSKPTTQTESSVEVTEEIPLQHVTGTGENGGAPHDSSSQKQPLPIRECLASISQRITSRWPFCQDRDHRKLAIYSVICGLSCVGVTALIYSVKVQQHFQ